MVVVGVNIRQESVRLNKRGDVLRATYEYVIWEAPLLPDGNRSAQRFWKQLVVIVSTCKMWFHPSNRVQAVVDEYDVKDVSSQKLSLQKILSNDMPKSPTVSVNTCQQNFPLEIDDKNVDGRTLPSDRMASPWALDRPKYFLAGEGLVSKPISQPLSLSVPHLLGNHYSRYASPTVMVSTSRDTSVGTNPELQQCDAINSRGYFGYTPAMPERPWCVSEQFYSDEGHPYKRRAVVSDKTKIEMAIRMQMQLPSQYWSLNYSPPYVSSYPPRTEEPKPFMLLHYQNSRLEVIHHPHNPPPYNRTGLFPMHG